MAMSSWCDWVPDLLKSDAFLVEMAADLKADMAGMKQEQP
jgi:hypothetical protein